MPTRARPVRAHRDEYYYLRRAEELSESADARLSGMRTSFFDIDPVTRDLKDATDNIIVATQKMYERARVVHSGPKFRELTGRISHAETLKDAAIAKEEAVSTFRTNVVVGFVPGIGMVASPIGRVVHPTFRGSHVLVIE